MSADATDSKGLQEFLSEAQDIAESLGKNLMLIDEAIKTGEPDPDVVNDVFRGMHTLKGLSGMFGVVPLATLTHKEENLLEEIRLGKTELDAKMLDLLFESVEVILSILTAVDEAQNVEAANDVNAVTKLMEKIDNHGSQKTSDAEPCQDPASLLGEDVFEVLTEYEEHRLRTNLTRKTPICFVHSLFKLDTIDVDLNELKAILKPLGEVITYLPSAEMDEDDKLGINIIVALKVSVEQLKNAVGDMDATVEVIVPGSDSKLESSTPKPITHDERTDAAVKKEAIHTPIERGEISPKEPSAIEKDSKESDPLASLRMVSNTVRVDIRKLDHLMNVIGELALIRTAISRMNEEIRATTGRRELAIELHRINSGFDRRLAELREGILEVRMVPLGQIFDRLSRMVRKISRELGKDIHFVISGSDTEVDKLIIEELSDPLMHIIRNAIDHGVEDPKERASMGKPEIGTVALTAYQKGNHVVIEVEDDGTGIDGEKLVEAALNRELITEEDIKNITEREVANLIFLPGVSTTDKTTEYSGRGVGMDVVKTNIAAMGGVVEVQSEIGIGTKFTVTLPVTLAIIPALLVTVAERTYAIPLNTVSEAMFISRKDVRTVAGTETITLRDNTLALCRLDDFFGIPRPGPIKDGSRVVVASLGQRRVGLVVDDLIGQQDVVIKALGTSLKKANCFSGATDIGSEQLALVVDTAAVIEEIFSVGKKSEHRMELTEWI